VLLVEYPALIPLAELAQPELKLAGLRFNPQRHSQSRGYHDTAARFVRLSQPETHPVSGLPAGAQLRDWSWSPDGARVAFAVTTASAVELWVAERASGAARRVGNVALNNVHPSPAFYWLPIGKGLICRVVPADLSTPPAAPRLPTGPFTDENMGKKSPAPTFQDLLKSEHDAELFAFMLRAAVVRVDLDGKTTLLVPTDMIVRAEPSPDGQYLLVETVHRPFSYLVPEERLPRRYEIHSACFGKARQAGGGRAARRSGAG
jgi:hypothetical protein